MNDQTKILVSILAKTDAIFAPMRQPDWTPPAPANFWQARSRFVADGVPWSTGKGSEASRKAAQRSLRELVAARLVVSCGSSRRRGVRLTPRADAYTRGLCGFPVDAHVALSRVALLIEKTTMFCSELWLIGAKSYGEVDTETLWTAGQEIMPAIVCGWVESLSDIEGRVYFRPTPDGLAAALLPAPKLPEPPAYDDDANAHYHALRTDARSALRTDTLASPGEIGFIPLPCSLDLRRPKVSSAASAEAETIRQDALSETARMRRLAAACEKRGNRKAAAAATAAADVRHGDQRTKRVSLTAKGQQVAELLVRE